MAFKGVDPPNIAHRCFNAADVELVLKRNGKAVKRAGGLFKFGIVCVQGFSVGKGGVEEYFVKAVYLLT